MTYSDPVLKVEVALEASPLDDFEAISAWTDLSARVRGFEMKRGRSDQLATFATGTASVLLDNADRELDPQNPDGLVYVGDAKGLPFCPVRLTVTYKGSTYPLMARAYIGPEGWPGQRSPYGTEATVTLNVVDATGLFAWLGMPSSFWRSIVRDVAPDWWLPGNVAAPADTADGYHVDNRSGTGGWATTRAANTRTVTDGVINTDTSLVSATAAWTYVDAGRHVAGTGIDTDTKVLTVTNSTTVVLDKPTTATATGVTVLIGDTVAAPLSTQAPLSKFEEQPSSQVEPFNGYAFTLYDLPASSWRQAPYVSLVSDEADVFPAGDVDDVTVSFMWLSMNYSEAATAGGSSECDLWTISGTDTHLRLYVDNAAGGEIKLQVFDGAGVELTTIGLAGAPGWDDGTAHGIVVRVVGGTSVDLFIDTDRATELVDVPSDAFAGDFVLGEVPGGASVAVFDEVMLIRRALTDTECERLATAPSAGVTWGRGETLAERLQLFYSAAGWTLLADEDDEWHPPPSSITSPDDPTLIGVAERGPGWPKTLGEAVAKVAAGVGGDFYALRSGIVRVRSLLATDDPARATDYATSVAHLTDEAAPAGSPPPVRRGPVGYSGTRFDRVVTVAEVTFLAISVDAGNQQVYFDTRWVEAVIDPYMPRTRSATIDTESKLVAQALALAYVERYGTPGVEVGAVSLFPTREESEALMDFVVIDLELERLVTLTDTPPVGDPLSGTLNVQGESWKWVGTDLVVTLNLART